MVEMKAWVKPLAVRDFHLEGSEGESKISEVRE